MRNIPDAPTMWKEPKGTYLHLDRAVVEEVKRLFPGQVGALCNMFLKEVIKRRPRIIFDMPFERPDNIPPPYQVPNQICMIDRRTRRVHRRFNTLFEAQQASGVPSMQIENVCMSKGKRKTAGGFYWRYADEVDPDGRWRPNF